MKNLLCFGVEGILVHPFREVKPFIIWFYLPLFYYDVSLYEVVELVVVIPTSPRSSETESRYKSYCSFRISAKDFWARLPVRGAYYLNNPALEFFLRTFGHGSQ
jgi:hypothetical protein